MTKTESILNSLSLLSDNDLDRILAACQVEIRERVECSLVDLFEDYEAERAKEDFDEALRRQYSESELEAIRRQYA